MGKVTEINVGGTSWVDLETPTPHEMQGIGQRFKFSQLELEDCLSKRQLQKIEHHEDHLFVTIHCPSLSSESHTVGSSQLSIFLGSDYLVTVHQEDLRPVTEAVRANQNRQGTTKLDPADVLHQILDRLVDSMFPLLEGVMKELDDIEDDVFNERIELVRELTTLRRNIAALRRTTLPLRRIIDSLYDEMQIQSHELAAKFRDVRDHIEKAFETLEEAQETVEIYKDTDFTINTARSNKILAFLTILFTLTIPATTIGTLYGMNIALPGGH